MIPPASRPDWRRWALRCGIAVALALLAADLAKLLYLAATAIPYRYDLDYGEGIVWQQMINIVGGQGYAPLGVFPAIVYHYPPVYYLVVHGLASLFGTDGLATGRMVSLLSTLVSMGLVGYLAYAAMPSCRPRPARLVAALIAGGCLASAPTILSWASLMRVDMLAGAFSLGGLALTLGAWKRPMRIALAALCFVLAVYTKQTSIAAPAAAFATLWLVRPRAGWILFGWCAALGLGTLAGLSLMSHGGFLRHTLLYNLNRVDLPRVQILEYVILSQISTVAVAILGVGATWQRLRPTAVVRLRTRLAARPGDFAACLLAVFLAIKTAMLPMVMKSGASDNYLIEWLYAVAVFVGIGALPVIQAARPAGRWPRLFLIAVVVVGIPTQAYRALVADSERDMATTPYDRIAARIARSPRPVVSDAMVLLIRGGQPVRWEPAIAAELGHAGLYDEAAFARRIRAKQFGFFVTVGNRGERIYDERYNPVVADAIDAAYPRLEQHGQLVLHLPR
ncbi:hypothetical protein [Sphingomonas sp. CARO-RG-8B-R24-01]|uniref:ArnT family glycosyltransferase n=1 Tax=Sphingomonas sp. CARO-RG-8B-R24-01 TaxID=2914831 RepID=UPI001F5AEF70|nr:hypothetical protein [Sphingomonas sp. CARO-RG-8B-R24-01]